MTRSHKSKVLFSVAKACIFNGIITYKVIILFTVCKKSWYRAVFQVEWQSVYFIVWVWNSIQSMLCVSIVHCFVLLNGIWFYGYSMIVYPDSAVDGHLSCCLLLVIMNKADMSHFIKSLYRHMLSFLLDNIDT